MNVLPTFLLPSALRPDSVVVVTGASSGIGEAVALHLAREHHHVVLAARHEDTLSEVAARCDEAGAASTTVVVTDVSLDDDVEALMAAVVEEHGHLDAVVHSAGEVTYGRTEAISAEIFDRVIATNLSGSANVARHAVRVMREQRRGTLLLVGSLLGHVNVPEMTPYVVSKWGLRALARQLHIENLDLPRVHVSHVSPGSVDTPIYQRALESGGRASTPPPPTISPERVSRVVMAELRHPTSSTQTAWANHALILAFERAPWAYDRLIGPAFTLLSRRSPDDADGGDGDGDAAAS